MKPEWIFGIAIVLVIAVTVWFNEPAAKLNGREPVPTDTNFHWMRHEQEVDGTLELTGSGTGLFYIRNNQLYAADDATALNFKAAQVTDRYFVDPGLDLGAWGSYTKEVTAGLRVSPARFLYGTTAPDALIGPHSFGLGISFYPPPEYCGRTWSHLGIGVGRIRDFSDGDFHNSLYLSFSTR